MKKMRVIKGVAFSALLALSLVATTGQAFAAQTKGADGSGIVTNGPGTGNGKGITWESAGITWE